LYVFSPTSEPPHGSPKLRNRQQEARADANQHDAVLDYYGRRLATCSSDRTIKIFEIEGETQRLTETLKGYVGTNLREKTRDDGSS
jgi:hypothetical protein